MTISEVWQKYKHLDEYFSDKKWVGTEEMVHTIFFEMWEAIKESRKSDLERLVKKHMQYLDYPYPTVEI